jgi:hypothetical protein
MTEAIGGTVMMALGILLIARPEIYQRAILRSYDTPRGRKEIYRPLIQWFRSDGFIIVVRIAGACLVLMGLLVFLSAFMKHSHPTNA